MTSRDTIAVTLPPSLVKASKDAVRAGRAASVSAYVAVALREKVLLDDLGALLDELLAETGGPTPAAEPRAADRIIRRSRKRKR